METYLLQDPRKMGSLQFLASKVTILYMDKIMWVCLDPISWEPVLNCITMVLKKLSQSCCHQNSCQSDKRWLWLNMIRISLLRSQEVSVSVFMISYETILSQLLINLKICSQDITKLEGATPSTFTAVFKKHLQEIFN